RRASSRRRRRRLRPRRRLPRPRLLRPRPLRRSASPRAPLLRAAGTARLPLRGPLLLALVASRRRRPHRRPPLLGLLARRRRAPRHLLPPLPAPPRAVRGGVPAVAAVLPPPLRSERRGRQRHRSPAAVLGRARGTPHHR